MWGGQYEPVTIACAGSVVMRSQRIAPPADGMALELVEAGVATQVPPAVTVRQLATACAGVTFYLLDTRPQSLLVNSLGRLKVKIALKGRLAAAVKEARHPPPCWHLACHAIVACVTVVWTSARHRG
mmetsp:Transcript_113959/g.221315  ORF Transcript_113959/g.221315 Transcript_113959/m.221315 type:complete len:127 (-) Transcript_113959:545-925(-)